MNGRWFGELQRRGVLRVAALYVIGAWVVFQVADVFFPAWGIPDVALRYLLVAAVLGFPIALVFGWMFDITPEGIRRNAAARRAAPSAPATLQRADFLALAGLAVAAGLILYSVAGTIFETAQLPRTVERTTEAPPNSLAVLPFLNISDEPDSDYFSDGISEEILHRLTRYRDLFVLARTSSFAFKDSDLGARRLTDILGVRYLLQGSVRKVGDTLRITAQLVDANDFQIWSESFDRDLAGVLAIQQEIAESVAKSLEATLSLEREAVGTYQPDVEAYRQYILGREYLRTRTPNYQADAIRHFEEAIAIDPRYADAHAGRAIAILLSGSGQAPWRITPDVLADAGRSVELALGLDEDSPTVLAANGLHLEFLDKHEAAEQVFRRALAIDPNLPGVPTWLANALTSQGKVAAALKVREEALARDPLDPRLASNKASTLSGRGRFAEAEAVLKRLLDLPSPPDVAYIELINLYRTYGRYDETIFIAQDWLLARGEAGEDVRDDLPHLATNYARLGMDDRADYWQTLAETQRPLNPPVWLARSFFHRLRGNPDAAQRVVDEVKAMYEPHPDRIPPLVHLYSALVALYTGDLQGGTEFFEPLPAVGQTSGDDLDNIQYLAYSYRQHGRQADAERVLEFVRASIARSRQYGGGRDPLVLAVIAQNHAIAGEREAALESLHDAVDKGYREYYYTLHDPRWQDFRGDPELEALLETVKANIDAMRMRVERADAESDFAARLRQLIDLER